MAIPAPLINQTLPSEPAAIAPGLVTPPVNSMIDAACASPGATIATALASSANNTTLKPLPVISTPASVPDRYDPSLHPDGSLTTSRRSSFSVS